MHATPPFRAPGAPPPAVMAAGVAGAVGRAAGGELAQLLRPRLVGGRWHKPALSGKRAAKLRKETLLAGGDWPHDPPRKPGKPLVFKGELKRARAKEDREALIAENLKQMPKWVAAHREERRAVRRGEGMSLVDRILLTPKQLRAKAKQK